MWVKARPRFLCLKQELCPDSKYSYMTSDTGSTASTQQPLPHVSPARSGPASGPRVSQSTKDLPYSKYRKFPGNTTYTASSPYRFLRKRREKPQGSLKSHKAQAVSEKGRYLYAQRGVPFLLGTETTRLLVTYPELES